MQFTVVKDTESLHGALVELARAGKTTALVPTMGALHDGHMSLILRAKEEADEVIVYIFVNPKQFGPNEDFGRYPRVLESDLKKADKAGAALVYAPSVEDVYPAGFSTTISVGELGRILEGKFRPGFFDGVATVLAKMFMRILPHAVVFGEKDYQQLCVVRRMVSDLDLPMEVVGVPTIREPDGLAMSSRNAYLSPAERKTAPMIYEVLHNVGDAIVAGASVKAARDQGVAALTKAGFKVDYLELRDAETLAEMDKFVSPARLLVAAWLGTTRLIDNIAVE
jgi:pantoate--beta-alanine ligase